MKSPDGYKIAINNPEIRKGRSPMIFVAKNPSSEKEGRSPDIFNQEQSPLAIDFINFEITAKKSLLHFAKIVLNLYL